MQRCRDRSGSPVIGTREARIADAPSCVVDVTAGNYLFFKYSCCALTNLKQSGALSGQQRISANLGVEGCHYYCTGICLGEGRIAYALGHDKRQPDRSKSTHRKHRRKVQSTQKGRKLISSSSNDAAKVHRLIAFSWIRLYRVSRQANETGANRVCQNATCLLVGIP